MNKLDERKINIVKMIFDSRFSKRIPINNQFKLDNNRLYKICEDLDETAIWLLATPKVKINFIELSDYSVQINRDYNFSIDFVKSNKYINIDNSYYYDGYISLDYSAYRVYPFTAYDFYLLSIINNKKIREYLEMLKNKKYRLI